MDKQDLGSRVDHVNANLTQSRFNTSSSIQGHMDCLVREERSTAFLCRQIIKIGVMSGCDRVEYRIHPNVFSWSSSSVLNLKSRSSLYARAYDWTSESIDANPSPLVDLGSRNASIQCALRLRNGTLHGIGVSLLLSDQTVDLGFSFSPTSFHRFKLLTGGFGLLPGGHRKIVRVDPATMYLNECFSADEGQNDSKGRYPPSSGSGSACRSVCGGFLLVFGLTLLKLAFYIADAPYGAHSHGSRILYCSVGLLSIVCTWQGVNLILELLYHRNY